MRCIYKLTNPVGRLKNMLRGFLVVTLLFSVCLCGEYGDWKGEATKIIMSTANLVHKYLEEEEINKFQKQLSLPLNDETTYSVIGPINAGKTTFFECLLGERLLPPGIRENTCVITRLQKSNVTIPTLISPANAFTTGSEITNSITLANEKCRVATQGKDEANIITYHVQVPGFPGLGNFSTSDKLIFVDYGGMNSANKAQNRELQKEFFQNSNAIIVVVTDQDIRAGQLPNILDDLKFLEKRSDILKENVYVMVNFLERCVDGSREYQEILKAGNITSFSVSACVRYLKDEFQQQLQTYMKAYSIEAGMFAEERILVVGLYDASKSLNPSLSPAEQKLLRDRSNYDELANTLVSNFLQNTERKKNSTLSFLRLVVTQLKETIASKLDEDRQMNATWMEQLERISRKVAKINEELKLVSHSLQKLNSALDDACSCELQDIPEKMDYSGSVKAQADAQLSRCVASVQRTISDWERQWSQALLSVEKFHSALNYLNASVPNVLLSNFEVGLQDFPKQSDILIFTEEREIRSKEQCGRHWHGGAKRCSRKFSRYTLATSDKNLVCSVLKAVKDRNRARLQSTMQAFLEINPAAYFNEQLADLKENLSKLNQENLERINELTEVGNHLKLIKKLWEGPSTNDLPLLLPINDVI